jgi:hypothetical protein
VSCTAWKRPLPQPSIAGVTKKNIPSISTPGDLFEAMLDQPFDPYARLVCCRSVVRCPLSDQLGFIPGKVCESITDHERILHLPCPRQPRSGHPPGIRERVESSIVWRSGLTALRAQPSLIKLQTSQMLLNQFSAKELRRSVDSKSPTQTRYTLR